METHLGGDNADLLPPAATAAPCKHYRAAQKGTGAEAADVAPVVHKREPTNHKVNGADDCEVEDVDEVVLVEPPVD